MKILILSSKVPFPPKDGGAIATLSLAEGLSDAGHEIIMLCLNTKKHFFDVSKIHPSLTKKIQFFAVNHDTRIKPIRVFSNYFFSTEPYNAARFHSMKFERELRHILLNENPDVVQLEGPYMGYYIPVIKKHSKAFISLRAHNVENEIWKRKAQKTKNPFIKKYLLSLSSRIENLEKRIIKTSDSIVAISGRDKIQLNKLCKKPSIIIPTGLNPYRYPTPKEPEFPSLFYIGALDWMPNQEGVMWFIEKVYSHIILKSPQLKLHIAGRNAPDWLSTKLKTYKSKGIIYHGEVDNAYDFMNKYAIFISPLFTGSGIRIKILEGMMMQRAIVATSIAVEGIPVSHRKNIFICDDPEEMAKQIIELTKDKVKYDQIGHESRLFVIENFNNLATSNRLSEFYRTNLI